MDIGDCVMQLAWDLEPMTALAVTPDGTLLVTATENGNAHVWDLRSGTLLQQLKGHTARCGHLWGLTSRQR
jgi:WD40 repeat protein